MVLINFGAPFAVMRHREIAPDINSIAFGCRHERTVRDTFGHFERRCPPSKFGVI